MMGRASAFTFNHCLFMGNRAGELGGAIDTSSTKMDIDNSTFACNAAKGGGAIFNLVSRAMTILHSYFVNNKAIENGGAIFENGFDENIRLDHVTLTGNSAGAENHGGALCLYTWGSPEPLQLVDCTIQLNTPDNIYTQ